MTDQQKAVGGNRLPILAHEINQAHLKVCRAARMSLKHAIAAGRLLLEAKEAAGHGKWLEWLSLNVVVSERTAQDYMRLAQHQGRLPPNSAAAADLTIRAAIGALIERKTDPVRHWRVISSSVREAGDVFIIDDNDSVDGFDFISHLWFPPFDEQAEPLDPWTLSPDERGECRAWKQPIRADLVRSILADLTPRLWGRGCLKAVCYTVPPEDITALIPHVGGPAA